MDRQKFKSDLQLLAEQNQEMFPDGRKLVNKLSNLVTKINSKLAEDENVETIMTTFSQGLLESVVLFFKEAQQDKDKARKNFLSRYTRLSDYCLDVKVVGDNKSKQENNNALHRKDFFVDDFINLNMQKFFVKLARFTNTALVVNNALTDDPFLKNQLKVFAGKKFTDFKFDKLSKQDGFLKNIQSLTGYLILLKQLAQLSLDVDFVDEQENQRRSDIGNAGPSSKVETADYVKKIHSEYTNLKIRELRQLVDSDKKLNTNWRGTKLIKEGVEEDKAADELLKRAEGEPKTDEPVYVNKYEENRNANKEIAETLYTFLTMQEMAYVFWSVAHGFNVILSYVSIVRKKLLDDLDGNLAEAQKYATQIRELNVAFDEFRNTIGKAIVKTEANYSNNTNEKLNKINYFIQNKSEDHSDTFVNSLKLIQKVDFFEIGEKLLVYLNGMVSPSGEQFVNRAVGGLNIIATKGRSQVKTFENPTLYLFNKIRQDILSRVIITAIPNVSDTAGGIDSSVVLDEIAKEFIYNIYEYLNKDKKFKLKFEQYVNKFYEASQVDIDTTKEHWGEILLAVEQLGKWANSVQINDLEEDSSQSMALYNRAVHNFASLLLPKIKKITETALKTFGTGFVERVLGKEEGKEADSVEINDVYFSSVVEQKFTGDLQKLLKVYMKCKRLYKFIYKINKEYSKYNLSIVRRVEITKSFVEAIVELEKEVKTNFYGVLEGTLKQTISESMEGFGQSLERSKSGLFLLEDSIKTFVDQIREAFSLVPAYDVKSSDTKLSEYYKELFFKRVPFVQAVHSVVQGEDIKQEFLVFMRRIIVLIILEAYYPGVNFSKIGSMSEFDNSTVVETLKGICNIYNLDYEAIMKKGMVTDENFENASGFKKIISDYLDYFVDMALSKDSSNKKRSVEDDKASYDAVVEITNNLLNVSEEDKIIAARNAEKIFVSKVGGVDKAKEFILTTKGNIRPRDFIKGILENVLKTYRSVVKTELQKYKDRFQKGAKKAKKEGQNGN